MVSLNKVTLIGNLGDDPEIRTLPGGGTVANFSVATTEKWKDRASGEDRERTEWHRCVCWNEGLTNVIERYARKGMQVYVEGQMQTRKWQDQEGHDRYSTEVVLTGFTAQFKMLGNNGGGNRDANDNRSRPGNDAGSVDRVPAGRPGANRGGQSAAMGDDIPF